MTRKPLIAKGTECLNTPPPRVNEEMESSMTIGSVQHKNGLDASYIRPANLSRVLGWIEFLIYFFQSKAFAFSLAPIVAAGMWYLVPAKQIDVNNLKTDVAGIKQSIVDLKKDVVTKEDFASFKFEIKSVIDEAFRANQIATATAVPHKRVVVKKPKNRSIFQ